MTFWDFLARVLDTWPAAVVAVLLALTLVGFLGWGLFLVVVRFRDGRPERADAGKAVSTEDELRETMRRMIAELSRQVSHLRGELKDAERRISGLLVMCRELDGALHLCAKECPDCAQHFSQAIARACQTMESMGLRKDALPSFMQRSESDG